MSLLRLHLLMLTVVKSSDQSSSSGFEAQSGALNLWSFNNQSHTSLHVSSFRKVPSYRLLWEDPLWHLLATSRPQVGRYSFCYLCKFSGVIQEGMGLPCGFYHAILCRPFFKCPFMGCRGGEWAFLGRASSGLYHLAMSPYYFWLIMLPSFSFFLSSPQHKDPCGVLAIIIGLIMPMAVSFFAPSNFTSVMSSISPSSNRLGTDMSYERWIQTI